MNKKGILLSQCDTEDICNEGKKSNSHIKHVIPSINSLYFGSVQRG